MKKRTLLLVSCLVIALVTTLSGTLAYLADSDADVNVMTLGKVEITQNEQEWNADETKLQPFSQEKPLLPVVGDPAWENTEEDDGAYRRLTMNNVVDKYVTVTNTGKSDAYVRTLIALEMGSVDYARLAQILHLSVNAEKGAEFNFPGAWIWPTDEVFTIDGKQYNVMEAVHVDPLAPGETTIPSLLQVYLKSIATNEDVANLDGNGNGMYDILVLSQAIQAEGFAATDDLTAAQVALNEGFGPVDQEHVQEWFTGGENWDDEVGSPGDKWPNNNPPSDDITVVTNLDELKAAMAEGGNIMLGNDIVVEDTIYLENGSNVVLDLNGKTITFDRNSNYEPGNPIFYTQVGSELTITGNGTIDLGDNIDTGLLIPKGKVVIENGNFIRNRIPEGTSPDDVQGLFVGIKGAGSSVVINGGYFDSGYYDSNVENAFVETDADVANRGKAADKNAYRNALKQNVMKMLNLSWSSAVGTQDFRIYGGTFVGANPAWGDEGCAMPTTPDYLRPWSYYQGTFLEGQQLHNDQIVLPDGYSITEGSHSDGRPTYTVNYSK
ncbi:MAG: hypothetical protein E7320_03560 [Clostridiales bacterium]|nr:hypothetical protein [Clostridiales bacterium]